MSDGATPWSLKFERVARICKNIGLVLPCEKTRGRILDALLAANNSPLDRDQAFFKQFERLSRTLYGLRTERVDTGKHIETFPQSPLDLPKDIFARAYPDAKPDTRDFLV